MVTVVAAAAVAVTVTVTFKKKSSKSSESKEVRKKNMENTAQAHNIFSSLDKRKRGFQ